MSKRDKEHAEATKAEVTADDPPVEEAQQDDVKGGSRKERPIEILSY